MSKGKCAGFVSTTTINSIRKYEREQIAQEIESRSQPEAEQHPATYSYKGRLISEWTLNELHEARLALDGLIFEEPPVKPSRGSIFPAAGSERRDKSDTQKPNEESIGWCQIL